MTGHIMIDSLTCLGLPLLLGFPLLFGAYNFEQSHRARWMTWIAGPSSEAKQITHMTEQHGSASRRQRRSRTKWPASIERRVLVGRVDATLNPVR
jgi:hypothetical protein